jgi:dipeptidyl aminopeptidase/acylaminoacyl peptidase
MLDERNAFQPNMKSQEVMDMQSWNEKTFAKFTYLSDIQISQDDDKIAFTATKANIEDDKYESIVIVKFLAENNEKYIENASRPKISPDGRKIAVIVNDEKEKKQVIKVCNLFDTSCKKIGKFDLPIGG